LHLLLERIALVALWRNTVRRGERRQEHQLSECCLHSGERWAGERDDSKYIWEVDLTGVELGEGNSKKTSRFPA